MSTAEIAEVISAESETEKEKGGDKSSLQTNISIKKQNGESLDISVLTVKSWDFDTLQYSHDELQLITPFFFSEFNLLDEFSVSAEIFSRFTKEISGRYINTNSYHNFTHGVDVLHAVYMLTSQSHMHKVYSKLEMFSLFTAALSHDVGHLAVNNVYLVKAKHNLAITYNDVSPLENMHCAELYRVLGGEDTNIFSGMTDAQWRESRKIILPCILGTDMTAHFSQIKDVQAFHAANGEEIKEFTTGKSDVVPAPFLDAEKRLFMMVISLHCADISNPYKKFPSCKKWAELIVVEFCEQGDREKAEGLEISPMCDRSALNLYNMQMGFIEFVVAPLIVGFINILPALNSIGDTMVENMANWGRLRKEEIQGSEMENKDEEVDKLDARVEKFNSTMSFLGTLKDSCS